jgi:hypothetical protein
MTARILSRLAAVATLPALLLAGCGPTEQFPPICPSIALLADAADLTQYNGKGQDLTDLVVDGRITAVPAKCQRGGKGIVNVKLKVNAAVVRGPAFTGRDVTVPVIVGVAQGETVLDRKAYTLVGQFKSNIDTVLLGSDEISLDFPVTEQKPASLYRIYVGFQLTEEQLALNRRRGPR